MPPSSHTITLFGATGYTGQLIARALTRDNLPFRIAGRSPEKLAQLSATLPNHPEWVAADVTRPASLPALFQDTRLLINCAGPFTDLGERVIAQAAMGGVHYLDITNELGYVFRARSYSDMARKTGAALVPACGFEVALADCAADCAGMALALPGSRGAESAGATESPEPIDTVNVVYALGGASGASAASGGTASSAGTRRSAVRSLATSWITYRNGGWTGQIPGRSVRKFQLPGVRQEGNKNVYAFSFPSCESITIPAHLPVRRVDTWMTTSPAGRFWAPVLIPLLARLSRSVLRGLILRIAARGGSVPPSPSAPEQRSGSVPPPLSAPERLGGSVPLPSSAPERRGARTSAGAPDGGQPAASPFTIYAEARRGTEKRSTLLTGQDPYYLTAEIISYAARQLTTPGYARSGLLAPAQALDPFDLLNYAQQHWNVIWVQP